MRTSSKHSGHSFSKVVKILIAILAIAGWITIKADVADAAMYSLPRPSCSFNDTSVSATFYELPSVIVTVEDYLNTVLVTRDKARTVTRYLGSGFYVTHTKQSVYDYWGVGWGENYAYNLDNAKADRPGQVTDC